MHEASMHDENCFVTQTYAPEHLPPYGSLRKRDFQLFMKRLRKEIAPRKVRYFHAGEYGDDSLRPHYHTLFFGWSFPDKFFWSLRNGHVVFRSAVLERLWPYGHSEIGSVTSQSAAYVAQYCQKKLNGVEADQLYKRLDPESGELVEVEPEYGTMSRRPGIGSTWYEKYSKEVSVNDSVVANGKEMRPPKYYDALAEMRDPEFVAEVKRRRKAQLDEAEQSPHRLTSRERVAYAKFFNGKKGQEL